MMRIAVLIMFVLVALAPVSVTAQEEYPPDVACLTWGITGENAPLLAAELSMGAAHVSYVDRIEQKLTDDPDHPDQWIVTLTAYCIIGTPFDIVYGDVMRETEQLFPAHWH